MAETDSFIYMLEPKSRAELTAEDMIAKRDAAVKWCKQACELAGSARAQRFTR